jgi:hypothetical protein
MDIDDLRDRTHAAVFERGFATHYASDPSIQFQNLPRAHTIGRTLFDRPEVLIVGPFTAEHLGGLLSELVAIDHTAPLTAGRTIRAGRHRYRLDPAEPTALLSAMAVFGRIEALQAVWLGPTDHRPGTPQTLHPLGFHPLHPAWDPYGPADPFRTDQEQR